MPHQPRPLAVVTGASAGVDALCANAGRGLGKAFIDRDFRRMRRMIDTNIIGTVYLIHRLGRETRARGHGRILITGAIAGLLPGSFQAVYHATKAFIDTVAYGLQNELKDSGVTVSCLMPGATETDFFRRADMLDTPIGRSEKSDPAEVAEQGYAAMMKGEADGVSGWGNKLMVALSSITPAEMLAEHSRKIAAPDTARH